MFISKKSCLCNSNKYLVPVGAQLVVPQAEGDLRPNSERYMVLLLKTPPPNTLFS